ncbi:DUF4920 domain-containing protein [Weeksella virosa]|uniref:DUF4920 domain-containing protein n=1 Tax=Weeksella virosa TaxID=1014 RepID=UPI0025546AD5|nr:DUF4920 domain-containing protein [Weeksella virosa]MDK7375533.1 DUF4920 domain-containing protein [Weeksella virosa]MDK7674622.1 DUF4920 domain-containing protein [Weeksella virosa]
MKKWILYFSVFAFTVACTSQMQSTKNTTITEFAKTHESFGEAFDVKNPLTQKEMLQHYKKLSVGDTLHNVQFTTTIQEVCAKKGCWMKLSLSDAKNEVNVRFKDYGFFVPMDASGNEAVVHGIAYVAEVSVDKLRHYAEDAGKSADEIAAITEPAMQYQFLADGVWISK